MRLYSEELRVGLCKEKGGDAFPLPFVPSPLEYLLRRLISKSGSPAQSLEKFIFLIDSVGLQSLFMVRVSYNCKISSGLKGLTSLGDTLCFHNFPSRTGYHGKFRLDKKNSLPAAMASQISCSISCSRRRKVLARDLNHSSRQ